MMNASTTEIMIETTIFTTPVGLENTNFCLELSLNVSLKTIESRFNIILTLKEINPTEATIIIQKTRIIFKTSNGGKSRPPDIRVHELKR